MKALVIGGTRFMGHELVWRLVAAGHAVSVLNRGASADSLPPGVERLHGDRTTADFGRLLHGRAFDAAVDFAAYHASDTQGVVDVLGDRLGHYVLISTGQVYLVRRECPRPAREVDYEGALMDAPADPADRREWDYGVGKRGAEDALRRAWEGRRFPATRLRLPMVNGARDPNRRIEGYLWRILDGGPVLLPDGGDLPMRHVYSGAVVQAILALLGDERTFGEAYNLAQAETPTLAEVVTLLASLLGAPARLLPVSRAHLAEAGLDPRALSPFSGRWMSFLDPGRARAELGFTHAPLPAYLGTVVASFLAHPPADRPVGYAGRAAERALAAHSTR